MTDGLVEAALDLSVVPPDGFVAARTARAAEAPKPLAAEIKKLRKPAPAAWVVNLLARDRRAELEDLLDLGAELRQAQHDLDREAITRLVAERRTRVPGLARAGASLAEEAGHPVTAAVVTAVANTLDAALADAGAADAVRSGRLVRALESIGFEPVDLAEAVAVPEAGSRAAEKRAAPERPRPRAVDDADAELARARSRADAVLAHAETVAAEASAEFTEAEGRLREARAALAAAQREVAARESARDAAEAALEKARDAAETARRKRRELG